MSSMTELESTATNRSNETRGMLKHFENRVLVHICIVDYAHSKEAWSIGARMVLHVVPRGYAKNHFSARSNPN